MLMLIVNIDHLHHEVDSGILIFFLPKSLDSNYLNHKQVLFAILLDALDLPPCNPERLRAQVFHLSLQDQPERQHLLRCPILSSKVSPDLCIQPTRRALKCSMALSGLFLSGAPRISKHHVSCPKTLQQNTLDSLLMLPDVTPKKAFEACRSTGGAAYSLMIGLPQPPHKVHHH